MLYCFIKEYCRVESQQRLFTCRQERYAKSNYCIIHYIANAQCRGIAGFIIFLLNYTIQCQLHFSTASTEMIIFIFRRKKYARSKKIMLIFSLLLLIQL